jgi:hypothetical protein
VQDQGEAVNLLPADSLSLFWQGPGGAPVVALGLLIALLWIVFGLLLDRS